MVKLFRVAILLMAIAPIFAPGRALAVEGDFWMRAYGPGTDLPAQPQPSTVFTQAIGEVGVSMRAPAILGFELTGAIETMLQPPEVGRFSLNASSVQYRFGFVRPLTSSLMVTFEHGSWHQLDAVGFIPKYNRLGLQFKFNTQHP